MSEGNTEAEVVDTGSNGHFKVTTEGTERLRVTSGGTLESYSTDDTTPNIKWRSNDTNWFGALNQSVEGGTITSFLSCGGDWTADGTTYSATKALAAYPTSAIAIHNQYDSSWGSQFVFLTKAGGSSTTDGTVSERLRIDSAGRLLVGTTTEGHASAQTFTLAASGNTGITVRSGSTNQGSLYFSDATSGAGEYAGWVRYDHGDNNLTIGTIYDGERIRIGSSGQIGIGGTNYGTTGQVLTSNGPNGSVSWTTISGGGGSYGNSDVDNHLNTGGSFFWSNSKLEWF